MAAFLCEKVIGTNTDLANLTERYMDAHSLNFLRFKISSLNEKATFSQNKLMSKDSLGTSQQKNDPPRVNPDPSQVTKIKAKPVSFVVGQVILPKTVFFRKRSFLLLCKVKILHCLIVKMRQNQLVALLPKNKRKQIFPVFMVCYFLIEGSVVKFWHFQVKQIQISVFVKSQIF